jgi:pimeloyl-ACP methyl ester carboxylesterase
MAMGKQGANWRRFAVWPLAIMVAVMAACGGDDDGDDGGESAADALAPYRTQTLAWARCDSTLLGAERQDYVLALGGRLECAHVRAPLNWSQPSHGDVSIAVARLAAQDASQRRGALLFNPGGPGQDGLSLTLMLWRSFQLANPASPLGAQQLKLMDSYDMVGFSPRGVGASTRFDCATNELARPVDYTVEGLDGAARANAEYNAAKIAEACRRNPITPHINTDATARDMDLIRSLLGEEKLNYVGYSYGTWLGAWYASLFPNRVGRVVLDSATDATASMEAMLTAQPVARQTLHDQLMLRYAARHADYFQLSDSAADIGARVAAISPRLKAELGGVLSGLSYVEAHADEYVGYLIAALALDQALQSVDPADRSAVHTAVTAALSALPDVEFAEGVESAAAALYDSYVQRWIRPPAPVSIRTSEAGWAVRCNDTPATTDPAAWTAIVRQQAVEAPLYFGTLVWYPCVYWGGPSVTKPSIAAAKDLDILLLQSQYDAATPTPGADRTFAQLAGARRIYVPGAYQHALFPYQNTCVDSTVLAYLLGESPKQRQTDCAYNPLPRDALQIAKRGGAGAVGEPTYTDSDEAARLIARFKQGLRPTAPL